MAHSPRGVLALTRFDVCTSVAVLGRCFGYSADWVPGSGFQETVWRPRETTSAHWGAGVRKLFFVDFFYWGGGHCDLFVKRTPNIGGLTENTLMRGQNLGGWACKQGTRSRFKALRRRDKRLVQMLHCHLEVT